MATPIKTIIWDLDGTILDSFGINLGIWSEVLPRNGFPAPTAQAVAKNYHGSVRESVRGLLPEAGEDIVDKMTREFVETDNKYINHPDDHLFADAISLVKRAHAAGVRQIVVTNRAHGTDRHFASPRKLLEHSALQGCFEAIICGDDVEAHKPKSEVLGSLLQTLNPTATLVVGDQFVDALFAYNLGASSILVSRVADTIEHMERLPADSANVTVVKALDEVRL